jgi:CheY-like chemotaxis protein
MVRVLVVDDDESNRESLRWVLTDSDYYVDVAATAQAGLDILLQSQEPLVVVFDYVMPEMTGEDLVRVAEHEVPFIERHAFICITASPDRLPRGLTDWMQRRGAPIVAKPFDVDALLDVIAQESARLPVHS